MNGKRAKRTRAERERLRSEREQIRRQRKILELTQRQKELYESMGSPQGVTHFTYLHEPHCPVAQREGLGMPDCTCNPIIRPGLPSEVLRYRDQ